MTRFRQENLAKNAYNDPMNAERISKLESLEVKDGKIILKVRAKGSAPGDATKSKKDAPVEVVAPPAGGAPKTEPSKTEPPPKVDDAPKTKAQPPAAAPAAIGP
jgi:hypothetical protein